MLRRNPVHCGDVLIYKKNKNLPILYLNDIFIVLNFCLSVMDVVSKVASVVLLFCNETRTHTDSQIPQRPDVQNCRTVELARGCFKFRALLVCVWGIADY